MPLPDARRDAAGLIAAAHEMGAVLAPDAAEALIAYRDLLLRWNRVYNLTAVRDPAEMWTHHLVDSLSAVAPLMRFAEGRRLRVLDVGSGGGLPGAVLAIARPDWAVVCVDAVAKKTRFVTQAALELRIDNLTALHGRIEELTGQGAEVIVSRAFASLADFTRLTRRHLAADGVWCAMKGKRPDAEVADLPPDLAVFHVEPLHVPELDADRHLIWVRPADSAIRSELVGASAP